MIQASSPFQGLKVDQSLDVRGIASPDAYHKSVDQLNSMAEFAVLELHIDEGEALEAVPFALRAEGHEIIISEPAKEGVRLLVRKRVLAA